MQHFKKDFKHGIDEQLVWNTESILVLIMVALF